MKSVRALEETGKVSAAPRERTSRPLLCSEMPLGEFSPRCTRHEELAASVSVLSSSSKIICGLCVSTQFRLAGCQCVIAHTPSLPAIKIRITAAAQSAHTPLLERVRDWGARAPGLAESWHGRGPRTCRPATTWESQCPEPCPCVILKAMGQGLQTASGSQPRKGCAFWPHTVTGISSLRLRKKSNL